MHAIKRDGDTSALRFFINLFQVNKISRDYVQAIRSIHKSRIFQTEIPNLVAYRNAICQRSCVTHTAPKTKAAKLIAALVDEIDSTLHPRRKKKAA